MSRDPKGKAAHGGVVLAPGQQTGEDLFRRQLDALLRAPDLQAIDLDSEHSPAALTRPGSTCLVVPARGDEPAPWRLLREAERCGARITGVLVEGPVEDTGPLPAQPVSIDFDQVRPLPSIYYDPLTGLPNRTLFSEWLARAVDRSRRQPDYRFAVLLLDLDRFKIVNDSLGHEIGDRLLIRIARRLLGHLRFSDAVARISGDEFTILLDDVDDVSDAVRIAERVHAALEDPFHVGGQEVYATGSIGIALSASGYDRPEEMLQDAETAMYRAKSDEARYEIFDPEMRRRARDVLRLESDLRRALEREEFQLHYQPIVVMPSGRISGFEALLRWNHPQRGCVSPGDFIPIAEETGLIVPIGDWVVGEACRQMASWRAVQPHARNFSVNVNLSRKQLLEPSIVERVRQRLEGSQLEPDALALEITESMVMQNPTASLETLVRLRNLGVKLCVDDFGTGYSSLSCLHRMPINTIKIDRSFVSRMGVDIESSEIVRTIVSLARNLNKKVVAEGVETHDQLCRLEALGCDEAQGFLFSRPVPAEEAAGLISRQFLGAEILEPTPA